MASVRMGRVKDYAKPYQVEYFNWACAWEWFGEFATKAEAIACIQAEADQGQNPLNFRIIVSLSFTVKVDQP